MLCNTQVQHELVRVQHELVSCTMPHKFHWPGDMQVNVQLAKLTTIDLTASTASYVQVYVSCCTSDECSSIVYMHHATLLMLTYLQKTVLTLQFVYTEAIYIHVNMSYMRWRALYINLYLYMCISIHFTYNNLFSNVLLLTLTNN